MDTSFGLPTHILAIHAPIALVPIAALVTVVLAVKPAWRLRYGWWSVGLLAITFVSVIIAVESGKAFNDAFDGAVDVSRHQELGETTRFIVLLWLVATIGVVAYERWADRSESSDVVATADAGEANPTAITWGLGALTVVLAVAATIWLVRTGHSGADAVWKQTTEIIF